MQRPISHLVAETVQRSPSRFAASAIAVGALHLALIYALMTGLAVVIVKYIPPDIAVFFIPPKEPLPASPPSVALPKLMRPEFPTVAKPEVKIDNSPANPVIEVATNNPPPHAHAKPDVPGATSVVSLMGTHTTPPYPPLSRRLGEEGCVGLRILIAADGHISDVEVSKSSGLQRLDDAAKQWVLAHWLYRAATNNGKPIASQTEALVIFNLKNAW